MDDKYPYKVYRDSECVMEASESCRYPKEIERSLLDAGYTIKLHGKKITKKEVNPCSRK